VIASFLLLAQTGVVTVGDTLWLERNVGSTGSAIIRPQPWMLGDIGLQLGPAEVRHGAAGATVRYALVLWFPGEHQLTMPGAVLVKRDGSSDTLPASTVRVLVTSVLPAGSRRNELPPKPARAPVALGDRSLLPLALLLGLVALAGVLVWLLRRRRGPLPQPEPGATPAEPVQAFHRPETLRAWAAAGEHRAALDGWAWLLARRLGESRDLEETARLQQVLDQIADSVFTPKPSGYFAALCRKAEEVASA
jgi:hypothetical protein